MELQREVSCEATSFGPQQNRAVNNKRNNLRLLFHNYAQLRSVKQQQRQTNAL